MPAAKKIAPAAASKKASKLPSAAAKTAPRPVPATKSSSAGKPIKETFTKAALALHLADAAGVDKKAVQAVLAALEDAILRSVHKKGVGEFALLGLVKIDAQAVPAKKKRFARDPFTGEDRWFSAKPATVRVKTRALKKLKDAAG